MPGSLRYPRLIRSRPSEQSNWKPGSRLPQIAVGIRVHACRIAMKSSRAGRIHHPWDGCRTPMTPQPERRKVEAVCWHCHGERRCVCATLSWGPNRCGKRVVLLLAAGRPESVRLVSVRPHMNVGIFARVRRWEAATLDDVLISGSICSFTILWTCGGRVCRAGERSRG